MQVPLPLREDCLLAPAYLVQNIAQVVIAIASPSSELFGYPPRQSAPSKHVDDGLASGNPQGETRMPDSPHEYFLWKQLSMDGAHR